MTFGMSRDDAEGKFLVKYVEEKILPNNPFEVIDERGVGRLMQMAVEDGRVKSLNWKSESAAKRAAIRRASSFS